MLVILNKSPWAENYGSILEVVCKVSESVEKVAILHFQDACIAATINEYCEKLAENRIEIYALEADCEARGLMKKVCSKVKLVDYKQWINLVMNQHDKIVSWTS